MGCLVHQKLPVLSFLKLKAGVGKGGLVCPVVCLVVDLIKGHPVFHLIFIAIKNSLSIPYRQIYKGTIPPCAVFRDQMKRHFIVVQRYYRLDAILVQFVKYIIVKLQACFTTVRNA